MTSADDDRVHVEQLPQSDWTDQDLLTKDEARQRLVEEIDRTRTRLGEAQSGAGDPDLRAAEVKLLTRRLNAMTSVCAEYTDYLDG